MDAPLFALADGDFDEAVAGWQALVGRSAPEELVVEESRLWLMRDARDGALLLQRLVDWANELEELARMPGGKRALMPLLRYVANVSPDLQLEQFRAILKGRAPAAESITMTIAEQLLAEGKAQGVAEGVLRGQAASLLVILQARGFLVTDDVRDRVGECSDADTLELWTSRAVAADSLEDVFAEP